MNASMVSIIWNDGSITELKSMNALRIAKRWLRIRNDVLALQCAGHLYLKERK